MRRPSTLKLAVIAVAVVAAGIAATRFAAASTASTPAPPPPDTGSTVSPIQPYPTTEYWTPERMRGAVPRPMPQLHGHETSTLAELPHESATSSGPTIARNGPGSSPSSSPTIPPVPGTR